MPRATLTRQRFALHPLVLALAVVLPGLDVSRRRANNPATRHAITQSPADRW